MSVSGGVGGGELLGCVFLTLCALALVATAGIQIFVVLLKIISLGFTDKAVILIFLCPPPHPPLTKGLGWGDGRKVWDRSSCCQCLPQRKTSCLFCNLTTLWNILMILGRNVEQDQKTCRVQE